MATRNMAMRPQRSRLKWALLIVALLIVALLIVAAVIYALPMARGYSKTGAAYAARVVCSCRFIGGRSLEDCEKDLEPGMEVVSLSETGSAKRVDATVPLMAAESAELRGDSGCVLMTQKEREAAR